MVFYISTAAYIRTFMVWLRFVFTILCSLFYVYIFYIYIFYIHILTSVSLRQYIYASIYSLYV
jgi:hypothetical protein